MHVASKLYELQFTGMRDVVPGPIIDAIQRYLQSRCQITQLNFAEMESAEELITESLGKRLQTTRSLNRRFAVDNRIWRWRVCFSDFFGDGVMATEPGLSADGLLQIEVEDHDTGRIWRHGLLFTTRDREHGNDVKRQSRMNAMESLTAGQSLVVEFDGHIYTAVSTAAVLRSMTDTTDDSNVVFFEPLGNLLANKFMEGTLGVRGLYYDAQRKVILVPTLDETIVQRFSIDYRISIEVSVGLDRQDEF